MPDPVVQAPDDTAPRPPLLDRVWSALTSPDVHARLQSGALTERDLDENVAYHTGGRVTSFQQLARVQQQRGRIAGGQDVQNAKDPGRLLSLASGVANEAALGLPEKLAPLMPKGSGGARDFAEAVRFNQDAAARYPYTHAAGDVIGALGPSAITGGAAVRAAEPLLSHLPIGAVAKMMARGAVQGGAAAGTAAYGDQPGITPDPKAILPAIGVGAGMGAATGIPAWWAATKLNPMEHLASRAVMESAPGDMPSTRVGGRALREGTTTPQVMGPPGKEIVFQALPSDVNRALPAPLRQLNGELSPKLRADAAKYLVQSPEAMNRVRLSLIQRLDALRGGTRQIEEGYNDLLDSRALSEDEIGELPAESQRAMRGLSAPTARDLFERFKGLRDRSSTVFDARDAGTLADDSRLAAAHQMRDEAGSLRDWLGGKVDGFNDMQTKVAPWLQRENELRLFMRQVVGRAIKPLGKGAEEPSGGTEEAVKELSGFTKRLISDRAARRFSQVLISDNVRDLFHAASDPELKEFLPDLIRSVPALAGATGYEAKRHLRLGPALNLKSVLPPAAADATAVR